MRYQQQFSYILSIILSLAALLIIFSKIGDTTFSRFYFNSDMLYDPVIFKDIFIDKTGFRGWNLNAAPNFFPDMFLYFIIMGIVRDFIVANFVFSLAQYFLVIALVYAILRQVKSNSALIYSTAFNMLMFLFLLIPVFSDRFRVTFQLISISFHMGSFIMFLISLNLLILYAKKKTARHLAWLFLAVLTGAFNDRLFIPQFLLPLMVLAPLVFLKKHRSTLLLPLLITIAGSISGILLFWIVSNSGYFHIVDTGYKMFNFSDLTHSLKFFLNYLASHILVFSFESLIIVITFFSFLFSVYMITVNRKKFYNDSDHDIVGWYLLIIITAYIPIVLFTPVINGAFISKANIRFNVMALIVGIMLPLVISLLKPGRKERIRLVGGFNLASGILLFTILLIFFIKNPVRSGMKQYFNFYPPEAAILDSLKTEHDLKYGTGNYWYAKYLTMFSREEVRVYSVYDHTLRPFYHSTNKHWFHDGGKGKHRNPQFNFVVRKLHYDGEILEETFQNELDTLYYDEAMNLLIIKVPEFKIDEQTRNLIFTE